METIKDHNPLSRRELLKAAGETALSAGAVALARTATGGVSRLIEQSTQITQVTQVTPNKEPKGFTRRGLLFQRNTTSRKRVDEVAPPIGGLVEDEQQEDTPTVRSWVDSLHIPSAEAVDATSTAEAQRIFRRKEIALALTRAGITKAPKPLQFTKESLSRSFVQTTEIDPYDPSIYIDLQAPTFGAEITQMNGPEVTNLRNTIFTPLIVTWPDKDVSPFLPDYVPDINLLTEGAVYFTNHFFGTNIPHPLVDASRIEASRYMMSHPTSYYDLKDGYQAAVMVLEEIDDFLLSQLSQYEAQVPVFMCFEFLNPNGPLPLEYIPSFNWFHGVRIQDPRPFGIAVIAGDFLLWGMQGANLPWGLEVATHEALHGLGLKDNKNPNELDSILNNTGIDGTPKRLYRDDWDRVFTNLYRSFLPMGIR